jgi:hypothetical protein
VFNKVNQWIKQGLPSFQVILAIAIPVMFMSWVLLYLYADILIDTTLLQTSQNGETGEEYILDSLAKLGDSANIFTSTFTMITVLLLIFSIYRQKEFLEKTDRQTVNSTFFPMFERFCNIKLDEDDLIEFNTTLDAYLMDVADSVSDDDLISGWEEVYDKYNNGSSKAFKYYFLNLFQLLSYINEEVYPNSEQQAILLSKTIRANLSQAQLTLLMYNSIGMLKYNRNDDYIKLITRYSLLKHMNAGSLFVNDIANIDIAYFVYLKGTDVRLLQYFMTTIPAKAFDVNHRSYMVTLHTRLSQDTMFKKLTLTYPSEDSQSLLFILKLSLSLLLILIVIFYLDDVKNTYDLHSYQGERRGVSVINHENNLTTSDSKELIANVHVDVNASNPPILKEKVLVPDEESIPLLQLY